MRNFWLFFIVFVPISCFKVVFLRKAIIGCELLNISSKHKKCKDSLEARAVLLIFLLEHKIYGVVVQSTHQNSEI